MQVHSLQMGRLSWSDKGHLVWWHQRIMAILTVVNIPKQEVLALRESDRMETDVRLTFPSTHRKQWNGPANFFFSVHSRFWWGMGDLTPPPNSVLTTQQTHIWNSCTTLITNSQLMSCTHREPRPSLDYLNIKALNYICWQHDATRTSLVLRKTLGEHHLLKTNIFIDS